jgi:CheY-like chemotaxis protein
MAKPKKALRKSAKPAEISIYVVDDEPMMGEVVEAILQLEGYHTRIFSDPEEALLALAATRTKPQLLLTDFVMPAMNGMELIEQAKRIQPDLKSILFSGNFGQDIMRYYPVKPDKFISKPFQPKALMALIKTVLAD